MKIEINWSQEKKNAVCEKIEEWIIKYASASCHGEGIMQDDNCIIEAPQLLANLVDEIIKPNIEFEESD